MNQPYQPSHQNANQPPKHSLAGVNPPGLDNDALLSHLINGLDEVSVILFDHDGRFLRCTDITAKRLGHRSPEDLIGKLLTEVTPADWAHERVELIRQTIRLGTRTAMLSILHGRRMQTIFNPIPTSEDSTVVLATVERITPERFERLRDETDNGITRIGKVNVLGELDVLSPRELEVLALLGQGHRPKDIAGMLSRSISTIDGHRERIGEKLGVHDRAALMSIARQAALQVDDASRTRNQIPPKT